MLKSGIGFCLAGSFAHRNRQGTAASKRVPKKVEQRFVKFFVTQIYP